MEELIDPEIQMDRFLAPPGGAVCQEERIITMLSVLDLVPVLNRRE